jgi:glycosyltransferase involved in cell wall biosynthesis
MPLEDANESPLVSIGIPTHNRAARLERAIVSALNQDYRRLEVIIVDNASTDATESVCRNYLSTDRRIKYFRQASNVGPIRNFSEAFKQSSGELFMWLADDDWLDKTYVRECVETLLVRPECSLVGGRARYYDGERFDRVGRPINLSSRNACRRVLRYYARVTDNAIFYGLMRRGSAARCPLRNVTASDWLFVSGLAFQGQVRTLESVCLHREDGGLSADRRKSAAALGSTAFAVALPFLAIATYAFMDVLVVAPVYSTLSRPRRFCFASLIFVQILISKSLLPTPPLRLAVRLLQGALGSRLYRTIRERFRRGA